MKKKILLVDDEVEMLDLLRMRLEASGYVIATAADGAEGIAKAKKERPDLVFLDVMMPKMDGYETCKLLKADPALKSVPVIMLSAKVQGADKRLGSEAGADGYLAKPFEGKDLLRIVRELLGE